MDFIQIIIILCMLLFNAVFAAYELALASIDPARLRALADAGKSGAKTALLMKDRMEASLAVVQLGITLVGAIAAALGGAEAEEFIAPWLQSRLGLSETLTEWLALAVVVFPLSAITIIFGELAPKSIAIRNAETVCLKLSPPMRWFSLSVYPAILALVFITQRIVRLVQTKVPPSEIPQVKGGIGQLLAQARAMRLNRVISREQERVIEGAQRLSVATVLEVCIPPAEIKLLNIDAPLTQCLVAAHLEAHTRFPVTQTPDNPQGIIGYVNVKDLLFLAKTHPGNPGIREIVRPLMTVQSSDKIGDALRLMLMENAHLAIVKTPDNSVAGIVTLEDILEQLVGDIQDEYDRLPKKLIPVGNQWIVSGGVTLARLRNSLKLPDLAQGSLPSAPFADWIESAKPQIQSGDSFSLDGLHILVRKIRRGKVLEALVSFSSEKP